LNTQANAMPRERSRLPLLLIALAFLLPAVGAWILYAFFPDAARSLGTTNYGQFVHPAKTVEMPAVKDLDGKMLDPDFLKGKWTYVYFDSAGCDRACKLNLYKMRQVRLAQGEDVFRVQRLFLLTGREDLPELKQFLQAYKGLEVVTTDDAMRTRFIDQFAAGGDRNPAKSQRVYLVDPLGRLMMYYEPDAEAKGMMKDLKKLLHDSQIG
jgi:cytochrome oxidase Cu insertion factor (SCO1/SenC/PrrC family)